MKETKEIKERLKREVSLFFIRFSLNSILFIYLLIYILYKIIIILIIIIIIIIKNKKKENCAK